MNVKKETNTWLEVFTQTSDKINWGWVIFLSIFSSKAHARVYLLKISHYVFISSHVRKCLSANQSFYHHTAFFTHTIDEEYFFCFVKQSFAQLLIISVVIVRACPLYSCAKLTGQVTLRMQKMLWRILFHVYCLN